MFTPSNFLIGAAIAAFVGLSSFLMRVDDPEASISISPNSATTASGKEIIVEVVVESTTPVNAFGGELSFDPDLLVVKRIDYNNSIADLWAEIPWYENGEGTINFAGGSTRSGGFSGKGTLLTIAFETKTPGVGAVKITSAQILKHDGLGTEVPLEKPIEALFIAADENTITPTMTIGNQTTEVAIASETTNLDLNGDGKQSIGDMSVMLQYLATGDQRGDINGDGRVSLTDASILLEAN